RRAQEPIRFDYRAEDVVSHPLEMASKLTRRVPTSRLSHVQSERAVVLHGQPGLGDDVDDPSEAVAVFRREAAGHDIGRVDYLGAQTGRKDGVNVFPERHAV